MLKSKIIAPLKKWASQQYHGCYYFLCRLCWKFIQTSNRKIPFETSSFPDLCPTRNATNIEAYDDRLTDLLLNKKQVTEIGLTSPYSGGKSSLIESYKAKHPYHKYTNISLADFKDIADTDKEIHQIEKSILQQILYSVNDETMPNSRFRKIVITKTKLNVLFAQTIGWLLFLISLVLIKYSPLSMTKMISTLFDSYTILPLKEQLSLLFLPSFFCLVFKDLYIYFSNYQLSKLNLTKAEITLDNGNTESVFNTYLEEILYYFATTQSNVVFFEDLDRLEKPEIFIKLKEINKIINQSANVKQKVCFIYAMKDDVFKNNDRTKFFDTIIPIIPIANSVNSYAQLKQLLEQANLLAGISDEFLRDIAPYIDDMRMLKSIVAEYGIYKQTLSKNIVNLELEKLFSFIIYKIIYCDDFSQLQNNKGLLATFVRNKHQLQFSLTQEAQAKIDKLKQSIVDSENEQLTSIEDLNAIYLLHVTDSLQWNGVYLINGKYLPDLRHNELFSQFWDEDQDMIVSTQNGTGYRTSQSFASFNNTMSPSYEERKKRIENKILNNVQHINTQISELKSSQNMHESMSVKELIMRHSKDHIGEKLDNNKLLIHLLEKGYIDEMYPLYTSLFHEGAISVDDMAFVLSVKNNEPLDPSQKLSNLTEILKYFSLSDCGRRAIFNYDLINHLLRTDELARLNNIIKMMESDEAINGSFILISLDYIVDKKRFLEYIVDNWANFWTLIVTDNSSTRVESIKLVIELLTALSRDNSTSIPNGESETVVEFINHIENFSSYLPEDKEQYSTLISALDSSSIKFKLFTSPLTNKSFLNDVLKYNLFEYTLNNFLYFYNLLNDGPISDDKLTFEEFINVGDSALQININNNIDEFVSFTLLDQTSGFNIGNENTCIELLNNEELVIDKKLSIIETKSFSIGSLTDISEVSLWEPLISNRRAEHNWHNVANYLKQFTSESNYLTNFVNSSDACLKLCGDDEKENVTALGNLESNFIIQILFGDMSEDYFVEFAKLFKIRISEEEYKYCPPDKLVLLITQNILPFDENIFEGISESNSELIPSYIEYNFNEYVSSSIISPDFPVELITYLLNSSKLEHFEKITIIEKFSKGVKELPDQLKSTLIDFIKGHDIEIPINLLTLIMKSTYEQQDKLSILTTQCNQLEQAEVFSLLTDIGYPYTKIVNTKTYTIISQSTANRELANALKESGHISSISSPLFGGIRINVKQKSL